MTRSAAAGKRSLPEDVASAEGLGGSVNMKLLHHALPPPLSDLNLGEVTGGFRGNNTTPERLGSDIFEHLTYFPWPRMVVKDMRRQGATGSATTVLLEDEELLHP